MSRLIWATTRENLPLGFANNTGTDQPAHLRSLISAFVIHFLESNIYTLATSTISIFYLVSVAEETGLNLALYETPEDRFSHDKAHIIITVRACEREKSKTS